jgi:hypothetical protein
MKNRFCGGHGADWPAAKTCEPLLDYLVDEEELHTVGRVMIRQLNASHGGQWWTITGQPALRGRYPGFDVVADASALRKPHLQGRYPITLLKIGRTTSSRWTITI